MKITQCCPICGSIFLNTYFENINHEEYFIKICNKNINHKLHLYFYTKKTPYLAILEYLKKEYRWDFKKNTFHISSLNFPEGTYLPWIEPDFFNYKKIIEKCETYLLLI